MRNIIKEIETKYPVGEITVNGLQVWPYLRAHYFFQHRENRSSQEGERQSYTSPSSSRLMLGTSSLYGVRNWFRKYDFVAITSAGYRRLIEGTHFNRFLDPIIDEIGPDRVLLIESPGPSHYPIEQVHTKNIVSPGGLALASWIAQKIVRKPLVENFPVLKAIQQEYGFEIPDMRLIEKFHIDRYFYKLMFRKLRPKIMFLTCYYGREAAIKAAHDLGIEVIEVQHGVIGKEHPAYNVNLDLDKSFFPDHLLVFGKKELDTFDNPRFINPTHVYPVGSFYIDYIKSSFQPDPTLFDQLRHYRRTVGVTLQLSAEKRLMDFISEAASLDKSIFYIIIPRVLDSYLNSFNLPENVTITKDHNFYEIMMYVDFHSTISSTCALEAPSLGVQNILVNIDNESRRYYETVLCDSRITRYVDTTEEYVETIRTFPKVERETVSCLNEHIIARDYRHNIQAFLKSYLQ